MGTAAAIYLRLRPAAEPAALALPLAAVAGPADAAGLKKAVMLCLLLALERDSVNSLNTCGQAAGWQGNGHD